MEISSLFLILSVLGLLMLLSAFFSGSETALSALTRTQIQRMRQERKPGNAAVIEFLDNPRRLFITVLFGNTLVNMAFISIMGTLIYDSMFRGSNPGTAYIVAILIETTVLLLFGEITPKTVAIRNAERLSRWVAPPLWLFSKLIYPFRRALRFFTDILLPLFGVHSAVDTRPITSEEIRATIRATAEGGAIHKGERDILSNIFELHDTKVKEIMTPQIKMVCVEVSATIQEAFQKAMNEGHSRLPVYRKSIDNICGIFYVKDLPRWINVNVEKMGKTRLEELTLDDFLSNQDMLDALNPGNEKTLIRPPFFVFKTRDIGSLLREMIQKKQQMTILLDEFGSVVGLATAEDIIEEVVGEIEDEYDVAPEQTVVREPGQPNSFLVSGALSLRSLNRSLKLKLGTDQADTVSGFVTFLAGAIPKEGDVLVDKSQRVVFEVLNMEGTRIDLVRIQIKRTKLKKSVYLILASIGLSSLMAMSVPASAAPGGGEPAGLFSVAVFCCLLILSLILTGFFSGSETAVVSASLARIDVLAQQSNRRALYIKHLIQKPDSMLGTVLMGTNLMNTAAGVAGLQLIRYALPGNVDMQELINTLVMTFVILLFCEILPKTAFRAKADDLALRSAPTLRFFETVFRPVVVLFTKISSLAVRFAGAGEEDSGERTRIMREELRLLAEMGEEAGALRKTQLRMVHGILALESRTVEKIMTPLVDIVALHENAAPSDFLETAAKTGFSRIPVYKERIDNIVGVVNVLDVLHAESLPETIKPFIRRNIRHEPESRRVFSLLRALTRSRNPMVFVVDEYGGVVGLVTVEDLVEEVMGDIWDEKDREDAESVQRISDRALDCDGKTEIQLLNHDYDLDIPEGDYITIAGFVIEKMQKIPRRGESLSVAGLKFLVLDADAKSVRRVRITREQV